MAASASGVAACAVPANARAMVMAMAMAMAMDGIRCILSSVRCCGARTTTQKAPTVGWVERSETHRPPAIRRTMGFAALYPSYESWLANDPEVRRRLRGRIRRAVVHVHVDGGCLRFANHFVGIDPVRSEEGRVGKECVSTG